MMDVYDLWKLTDPNDTPESDRYSDLCAEYGADFPELDDVIKAGLRMNELSMSPIENQRFSYDTWWWLVNGYSEIYQDLVQRMDADWIFDEECEADGYNELKSSNPWGD